MVRPCLEPPHAEASGKVRVQGQAANPIKWQDNQRLGSSLDDPRGLALSRRDQQVP